MVAHKDRWERLKQAAGVYPERSTIEYVDDPNDPRPKPPKYEHYILDEGLAAATEIAIRLRQPLLLTGEPGTGKTRFARALSHQLGLPLLVANIRSSTTVADLFYNVDELSRFRDTRPGAPADIRFEQYLSMNALGRAILFAGGPDALIAPVRTRLQRDRLGDRNIGSFSRIYPTEGFPNSRGSRTVVLLDEFDKAPRDTPNDMLNELEDLAFEIPEMGIRIRAPEQERPIIIITSNSERSLPDPFLRRCIYHDIPFPNDPERLAQIVWGHLKIFENQASGLLKDTVSIFLALRQPNVRLTRRPGTAELLDWLEALTSPPASIPPGASITDVSKGDNGKRVLNTLSAIVKAREDQAIIENIVKTRLGLTPGPAAMRP